MILGSGMRMENEFMSGIAISQLGDMAISSSYVGGDCCYYNNKIYQKVNSTAYSHFQVLDIITGEWYLPTDSHLTGTLYGLENIGDKIYAVTSYASGSLMAIRVTPYTPATDSWGTTQTVYHNYNEDMRVCAYENYLYILYEYSNVSDTYTWHLIRYDTSASTLSSDLNFSVQVYQYTTAVEIVSNKDCLICVSGSYIYKYNPATNSQQTLRSCNLVNTWRRMVGLENGFANCYRVSLNRMYFEIYNTSASILSGSIINLPYYTFAYGSKDGQENIYVFEPYISGTNYNPSTYRIVPK